MMLLSVPRRNVSEVIPNLCEIKAHSPTERQLCERPKKKRVAINSAIPTTLYNLSRGQVGCVFQQKINHTEHPVAVGECRRNSLSSFRKMFL